ncbi:DUF3226 domain-containing protein [uncultured Thiodictyon sp.]|jgi:hypothetical protein|uniref:DUF3226 domain-containing protein n=1 Tax=uncultured Thiodictyon sp. TaxID=1846217 RepID=UPI0025D3F5B0|nr:DUF3226 domain-containing protein [uncultured Thiodictyon sp.]
MRHYGYLVVEGPHDIEFSYRLLSPYGLTRVQLLKDLDPVFERIVPSTFPHAGDLQKRVPVPLFLQSATHAIAVHSAVGDSQLIRTLEQNVGQLDDDAISSIGILLDADQQTPTTRYANLRGDMAAKGLALDATPGQITTGKPRLGAFVLPDNRNQGTLEDLLLESAQAIYPGLLASAQEHVNRALLDTGLTGEDVADVKKPAGRNKAIIGAMASILRPGKAVQTSLQDNRWLRAQALAIPRIAAVQAFLAALFELPRVP